MRLPLYVLAAAVALLCSARAVAQLDEEMGRRVSAHLLGSAMQMSASPKLNLLAIESATILAREATRLDPDSTAAWRYLRDLATLAERPDYYEMAVRRLAELDPDDDVVRLAAVNLDLEKTNNIEERLAAYRRLLDPSRRDEIGDVVASRLAFDVALLEQRRGNVDAFAEALADAIALDPSNRAAMAIAAGFFRMNVDDPYAEAELLAGLARADPTDVTTLIALGEHMLEHGAYGGAVQMYDIALTSMDTMVVFPRDQLVADACIAKWGNGDAQTALRRIRRRQQEVDETAQMEAYRNDPTLDSLQRAAFTGHIDPTLATVRAAIRRQRGDVEADADLERALAAYDRVFERSRRADDEKQRLSPDQEAMMRLERAWIAAWLGRDVDRVEELLAEVESIRPIGDAARARFDGWLALRRRDPRRAIEIFERCAEDDLAVLLGRGEAHRRLGQRAESARAFLAAARLRPGTLMGVWAANEVWTILGQRHPISPDAARLEGALSALPPGFERYPVAASLAVDLHIEPAKPVFQAYEPVIINLRIRNNSPDPLAIDDDGPIHPEVILTFATTMRELRRPELRPLVVNIGRRLRLEPREELVIPVNLRHGELGTVLASDSRQGLFIRVKAVMNFHVTQRGAIEPGLLGAETLTPMLRIEGVRVGPGWIQEAMVAIQDPREIADLDRLAILIQSTAFTLPADAAPEMFQLVSVVRDATAQAYASLGGMAQAWLLCATPTGRLTEQMRGWAQQSPDRTVRLLYLLFHLTGADDPMLDPTLYPDDPELRFFAQQSADIFEAIRAQYRLETQEGR